MLLDECIVHHTRYRRNKTALVHGDDRWTFGALGDAVSRCANLLAGFGIRRGDRVAILTENSPWFMVALFATARVGAIFTPLNYRLSGPELVEIVRDCEPGLVIGQPAHLDRLLAAEGAAPLYRVVGLQSSAHAPALSGLLAEANQDPMTMPVSPDDPVMLQYTSGTTGRSKGVLSKHSAWMQSCAIQSPLKSLGPDSVFLGVLPMCYTGGLKASLEVMFPGATMIVQDRFDAEVALDAIEAHGVTNTYVVPTIFYALLDAQSARPRDLATLRWVNCGGAPLSERRLHQAVELFDCHLTQGYGMTEMAGGSISFAGPKDHIADGVISPKLKSVGRPLIDCHVKLVDEDGLPVRAGEPGEVLVRSDRVMLGYWRGSEPSPVDEDGFLHTGDIAREDEDGYLFIVDRKKDMIISGGLNIYSKEVEDVMIRHAAVQEAYVVGLPDERWGESVHAFVVLRQGGSTTAEELEQWCRSELSGYKCPRSFAFVDKSDLPINWGGKVQKRSLREAQLLTLNRAG